MMITDIEDYFSKGCGRCGWFDTPDCSTKQWPQGLRDLRRICLDVGLSEHVKWAHPCYMHAGRNICIFGAFRGDYRLTFMNAALMKDPARLLVRPGQNTRHPDMMCFTDDAQAAAMEPVIRAYLTEAMGYAQAGIKPAKMIHDIDIPDELTDALDADPDLAEAFEALTPGRQRSYAYALNSAKTAATRINRIAKFRPHILAGKGALER